MPTMQEKIVMVISELHPTRTTKENIYMNLLKKYQEMKITTFVTELYNLVRKGVVCRGEDGLYGLGVYRTKQLEWLPDTQEPIVKIGE